MPYGLIGLIGLSWAVLQHHRFFDFDRLSSLGSLVLVEAPESLARGYRLERLLDLEGFVGVVGCAQAPDECNVFCSCHAVRAARPDLLAAFWKVDRCNVDIIPKCPVTVTHFTQRKKGACFACLESLQLMDINDNLFFEVQRPSSYSPAVREQVGLGMRGRSQTKHGPPFDNVWEINGNFHCMFARWTDWVSWVCIVWRGRAGTVEAGLLLQSNNYSQRQRYWPFFC